MASTERGMAGTLINKMSSVTSTKNNGVKIALWQASNTPAKPVKVKTAGPQCTRPWQQKVTVIITHGKFS